MNAQVEGYPRNRDKESILTHWLHTAKSPGGSLPSGHLRRRQNKYLQLSSSLFGDQDERDKIRHHRDIENKDKLRHQLTDYKEQEKLLKAEDDRVYKAMGIPVASRTPTRRLDTSFLKGGKTPAPRSSNPLKGLNLDTSFLKRDKTPAPRSSNPLKTLNLDTSFLKRDKTPAPRSSNPLKGLSLDTSFLKRDRTAAPKSSNPPRGSNRLELKPDSYQPGKTASSYKSQERTSNPSKGRTPKPGSYPVSNRERREYYEPSFGQHQSRSRAPQGGNFSHLLKRRHSFDYAPTEGQRDNSKGRSNQRTSRRRGQSLEDQIVYLPGSDGRLYPYYPLLYPSIEGYPGPVPGPNSLSNRRSESYPTINVPRDSKGYPIVYIPVPRAKK